MTDTAIQQILKPYFHGKLDIELRICTEKLSALLQQSNREYAETYKLVVKHATASEWLRNTYGLDDDDTLNAGEVEELLETFINEYGDFKQTSVKDNGGNSSDQGTSHLRKSDTGGDT